MHADTVKPKISVIIPVFNVERFLRQCLDSVLFQTLTEIEIIIVNDYSTDGSKVILDEYAARDNRIKLFHLGKNRGTHYARKVAVSQATGDYIVFLDSDDYYTRSDALADIYNRIESTGVDILMFSVEVLEKGHVIETPPYFITRPCKIESNNQIIEKCFSNIDFNWNLWNKIYKASVCKKAFEHSSDVRIIFATDVYAFFLLAFYAHSFLSVITEPVVSYQWDVGVSTVPSSKNLISRIDALKTIDDLLNQFIRDKAKVEEVDFLLAINDKRISEIKVGGILYPYLMLPFESRSEVSERLTAFYSSAEVNLFSSLQSPSIYHQEKENLLRIQADLQNKLIHSTNENTGFREQIKSLQNQLSDSTNKNEALRGQIEDFQSQLSNLRKKKSGIGYMKYKLLSKLTFGEMRQRYKKKLNEQKFIRRQLEKK